MEPRDLVCFFLTCFQTLMKIFCRYIQKQMIQNTIRIEYDLSMGP